MEVMVGFRYLFGLIHSNVPLLTKPWISMEQCRGTKILRAWPFFTIDRGTNRGIHDSSGVVV